VAESCIIVIGAEDILSALKARVADEGEVLAFADTETLRALDAVNARHPDVVALDRLFAGTARGAALINRIKADPKLDHCEIRVIAHDSDYLRVSRHPHERDGGHAPAPAATYAPQAIAVQAVAAPAPALDHRGTRRAQRFRIQDRVEVLVDGNPATLIDLSTMGAQLVSPTVLRPNQRVRVTLPDDTAAVRFNASIAWASFELPRSGTAPQYRAGVEFADADQKAVAAFCTRHKRQPPS
jgi:CheY-like chemotaxis protein